MRKVVMLLLAMGVAAAGALAHAAEGGEQATVSGEVVDLACYVPRGDKGRGASHQECAEMCAKGGQPLGVLSESGELVLLVEDHAKPAPYGAVKKLAGQNAQVSGQKFTRNGLAVLVVQKAEAQ
ncbi:MAG: hypothetical protein AB1689_15150 [Thermodesulfobacteriota bacterium]